MSHPQAESMLKDRLCFSQGILKALLLHTIPLQKCLGGVFCCFYDLAGLWLQGMSCSGSHKALHPKGMGGIPVGLAAWDTHIHTQHASPTAPVCEKFQDTFVPSPLWGWQRAACPSVQFRAASLAEHSCARGLGHCGTHTPRATAQHSSVWCLQKANVVCLCVICWCTAPKSLFLLSALFSLLDFNFLLLLNFVK